MTGSSFWSSAGSSEITKTILGELQLAEDVVDEEFVARNRQAVLGIEVFEVRELVDELVAQAWIGEDLPVTVAFASLYER